MLQKLTLKFTIYGAPKPITSSWQMTFSFPIRRCMRVGFLMAGVTAYAQRRAVHSTH